MSESQVVKQPLLVVNVLQYSLFLPNGGNLRITPLNTEEKIAQAIKDCELEVFAPVPAVHYAFEDVFGGRELPPTKRREPLKAGERFIIGELIVGQKSSIALLSEQQPTITCHLYQVEILDTPSNS